METRGLVGFCVAGRREREGMTGYCARTACDSGSDDWVYGFNDNEPFNEAPAIRTVAILCVGWIIWSLQKKVTKFQKISVNEATSVVSS